MNNKLEIFNKAPNKSNEQKDEKKLLTPVKPNVNQLENLQDRTKFKSVMAKFNSPTTLSNEVKLEETKKNTSNIPVKPSQINIFQKNKETANVPGKILKTWENPKEQNPSKPQIEDPIKIEGNSVIKEKIEGFKKSNEKKEPSVDTLKVVDQVSVKKLSANLSMMNLPFRNYPGPAIKPPVISEKEIEQTQIINDDFNNVLFRYFKIYQITLKFFI